jgi:hypothetical protein
MNFDIKETIVKAKKEVGTMPQWNSDMPIPRTFRWLLSSKTHPDIQLWMKQVNIDYLNKVIDIQVYDDAAGEVFRWLESNHTGDMLTMAHLDATQIPFCSSEFSDLMLTSHTAEYDYAKNDVLTHFVKIKYGSVARSDATKNAYLGGMIPS